MSAPLGAPSVTHLALLADVSAFLYLEARLADESDYERWLALWTDDAHYWVPAGMDSDYDRDRRISFINDNRNRLTTRVRQLQTGVRYAQSPPSPMRRVLANIELLQLDGRDVSGTGAITDTAPTPDRVVVGANFVLYELAVQAANDLHIWAGRTTHHLRREHDRWRLATKIVELVNASQPIPNLAFLL